jgi:hypothetical protein
MIIAKTQTLVKPYQWVWKKDPALDAERDGFDQAYEAFTDHGDIALLEPFIRAGEHPSVFTLRHLAGRTKEWWTDRAAFNGSLSGEGVYLAAALAIASVRDMAITAEDGETVDMEIRHVISGEQKQVAEDQMQLLAGIDEGQLISDLGARVVMETVGAKKKSVKG